MSSLKDQDHSLNFSIALNTEGFESKESLGRTSSLVQMFGAPSGHAYEVAA
jgi:hypothetical protein